MMNSQINRFELTTIPRPGKTMLSAPKANLTTTKKTRTRIKRIDETLMIERTSRISDYTNQRPAHAGKPDWRTFAHLSERRRRLWGRRFYQFTGGGHFAIKPA